MTATPRLLAYCASPNRCFDERAEEVARLYDGFFFVVGDWEQGVAAHLVATVTAPRRTSGFLWLGWDDGLAVWLNGRLLLDRRSYPPQGHGLLFRDRYLFEERVPVTLPRGSSRLALTSVNATGVWACSLRFGDGEAYPLPGLRFSLPRAPR